VRISRLVWTTVLAGLLTGSAANATVYYISPTGSASAVGTSAAAPWSLAKANSSLQPGDVCIAMPGTYSAMILPANTSPTGPRITVIGNLVDPSTTVFTGDFETTASYLTVKGLTFTGGIQFDGIRAVAAQYDSVAWCRGKTAMFAGAKHCVITRCKIVNTPAAGATVAFVYGGWQDYPGDGYGNMAQYDTLSYNTIDMSTINWRGFLMRVNAQWNYIKGNQISALFGGTSPDVAGRYMYNSSENVFEDNKWTFEALGDSAASPWDCFALRDSSCNNSFVRDTVFAGLQNGHDFQGRFVNAGADHWNGFAVGNAWHNCFYYMNGYVLYQINSDHTFLDHSVFAAVQGSAILITTNLGILNVDHCTFYSGNGRGIETTGSVIAGTPPDSLRFTSNIFYAASTDVASGIVKWPATSGFRSSSNVWYTPAYHSVPGDLAVNWFGQTASIASWCSTSGMDCNSHYADPLFVNANAATFNPHLLSGSAAIGAGVGGTDAGAFPFAGGANDVTPPAAVTDLAATNIADVSLTLQWTAPGNDGMSGQASVYDLRQSTSAITAANFASATAVTSVPAPVAAGSLQTFVLLGLTTGQKYYFALKTQDAAGNWSAISNLPSATTVVVDHTRPAAVVDLSAH